MTETTVVTDWYGNTLPVEKVPQPQKGVKGERSADGKMYLRQWSDDGKPGKRVALEDSGLVIHDANGMVVYAYWQELPAGANIQPGYVGFLFEEILKGYFDQGFKNDGKPIQPEDRWIETTEDGQKFWRWNVIWHDRLDVNDPAHLTISERNENGTFETKYDSRCNPPQLGRALIQRFQHHPSESKLKPS